MNTIDAARRRFCKDLIGRGMNLLLDAQCNEPLGPRKCKHQESYLYTSERGVYRHGAEEGVSSGFSIEVLLCSVFWYERIGMQGGSCVLMVDVL